MLILLHDKYICLEQKDYLNNMNVKGNIYSHWRNSRVVSKQRGYLHACMHTFFDIYKMRRVTVLELSIIKKKTTLLNPWAHVQAFGQISINFLFV